MDPRSVIATFGLVALVLFLAVRDEFPLADAHPLPDVAVSVEAGAAGTEHDSSGAFWWLTSPHGEIWVFNNRSTSATVDVDFELIAPPCAAARTVRVDVRGGDSMSLTVAAPDRVHVRGIDLAADEAVTVELSIDGEPCSPGGADPRQLYVMVRDLSAR